MKDRKSCLYFTDNKVREEIDNLLRENASIEASLGTDSTQKEIIKAKVKQDRLFRQIKKIDSDFYKYIVTDKE